MVIAAALCAFTAAISFAQEVSFENKLSSGLVNIDIINGDSDTSFAGITNEAEAGYSSEKLDMGVKLIIDVMQEADNSLSVGSDRFVDDYYIEFRPVKYIGIGEKVEDLTKFNSDQFVDAIFNESNTEEI